jgi:protein gp37
MARRLRAMGQPNYVNGFRLTVHENALEMPLRWKKPQRIFVNSMSDLFHEEVPDTFIFKVFKIMRRASWHQFQILTKRSHRLREMSPHLHWADNIWMGVSVENRKYTYRIEHLFQTGAGIKFVSFEPLLGPVGHLHLRGIDWVIVGGESGPRARQLHPEWVIDIRDQCLQADVAFFFKQWGGVLKKKAGRQLEGRTWDEMPLPEQSKICNACFEG